MRSRLSNVPYTFDEQHREFLEETEIHRLRDIPIAWLTNDIQALAAVIGDHDISIFEAPDTTYKLYCIRKYFIQGPRRVG